MDAPRSHHWARSSLYEAHVSKRALILFALLLTTFVNMAMAQTNLVQNGTFVVTPPTGSTAYSFRFGTYTSTSSPWSPTEQLAGWTSTLGYNFVFLPSSTVATGTYGNLSLWSPASSPVASNGFTNSSPTGNFIAADADYGTEPITQNISGLTPGATYAVSFAWAGAQQSGYTGATTEQWEVNLGSNTATTQDTAVINIASTGFSGWMNQTLDLVATSSSEMLSFLANGTPAGVPPFALLSDVTMTKVPEPTSVTLMITAVVGLIGVARRRRISGKTGIAAG